jgi:hypothetical protein
MGSYHVPGRRTLRPYHRLGMSIAPCWVWSYPVYVLLPSNHFESLTRLACFFPCLLLRRRQQGCDNVRRRATTCGLVIPLGFLQAVAYDASQQHPRDFKTQACTRRATDHRLFPLGSSLLLVQTHGVFFSLGQSHGEFLVHRYHATALQLC